MLKHGVSCVIIDKFVNLTKRRASCNYPSMYLYLANMDKGDYTVK